MYSPSRATKIVGIAACVASSVGVAWAARDGDRDAARATISHLERQSDDKALLARPLDGAKDALRRADEARAGGDHEHAALLEALGREWAETGSDMLRAHAAEKKLAEVQKKTANVETKLTRARALLEDTVARRGRAQAALDALQPGASATPSDGGTK